MKRTPPVLSIVWAFAFLTFFVAGPAAAQPVNPLSSSYTSAHGMMRMVVPKDVVLGEQFDIVVTVPKGGPEENEPVVDMRWYPAGQPGQTWEQKEQEANAVHTPDEIYPDK